MSRAPLGGALLSWGSGVLGAGTLVYGGSIAFSDAPFLVSIILHLLLGIALTGVIFVAGSGLVLLTAREAPAVESLLLRAFVPGAVVAGLVAALIIFVHLGITIAIILILLVASPLLSYRPNGSALSRIKTGMFIILPVTLIFATEVGLLFHGPTGTISGAAHGDSALAIHYAVSISQQFAPLRNLGIEGAALGYAYFYSALLTGALLSQSWYDPFLFMSVSLVVMSLISMGLLLTALASVSQIASVQLSSTPFLTGVMFFILAPRWPSWVVESPSVAFALPILISFWFLWRRSGGDKHGLIEATANGLIGIAISKLVILPVILPLLVAKFLRAARKRLSSFLIVSSILSSTILLIYAILMVRAYAELFIPFVGSLVEHVTPPRLARDIGAILLALLAKRIGPKEFAFASWVGACLYISFPSLFHATLMAIMVLLALLLYEKPERIGQERWRLFAGVASLVPYFFSYEPGGYLVSLTWIAAIFLITISAFGAFPVMPRLPNWHQKIGAGLFAGLAVGLFCNWLEIVPHIGRHLPSDVPVYTPTMRDIWLAVRDLTPTESLIFTDQTGNSEDRLGGWNDYASISGRQFYFVSWAMYAPLRFSPELRDVALRKNEDVLSGKMRPDQLNLSRTYQAYFAVIASDRLAPVGSKLLYRNSSYSLYRLE